MPTQAEAHWYRSTHIFGFCVKLPGQQLVIWQEACCRHPPGLWRNLWLWCSRVFMILSIVFPGFRSIWMSWILFFTQGRGPWYSDVLFTLQRRGPRLWRWLLWVLFFLPLNWPRLWCLLLLLFLLNVSSFAFRSFLLPLARSWLGFGDVLLLVFFLQRAPEFWNLLLPVL